MYKGDHQYAYEEEEQNNRGFYYDFQKTLESIYPGEVQRKRIKKEVENLGQIFENLSMDISYTATSQGVKLNIV